MIDWILIASAPVFGSFIGALTDRWPNGRSMQGRSACQSCGTQIKAYDLIPLLSFLLLKGRCRSCEAPIPLLLPIIELTAPILITPVMLIPDVVSKILFAGLVYSLLTLSILDIRHYWLPDRITLALVMAGLIDRLLHMPDLAFDHAMGAAIGYILIWGLHQFYLKFRGIEAIGLGDAKLLAAAGAWLGLKMLAPTLLIASVSGIITTIVRSVVMRIIARENKEKDTEERIAFGVYLAIAFYLLWIVQNSPAFAGYRL